MRKIIFLLTLVAAWATASRSINAQPVHSTKPLICVRPLDLSRAPSSEELMAAGQLGGLLYPTRQLQDKARDEAARLDFGNAIEKWNRHEYPEAVELFKRHVQKFPDSPWADEATLHIGCDATYNGNYPVAETAFTQLIAVNQGNDDPGAKMMWSKATQRLALVKVEENNLEEAHKLFLDLKQNSPDLQLRTYGAHWLQRLSGYVAARESLLNCGAVALAYVLEKEGHAAAAANVRKQIPQTMRGHSMKDLMKMASDEGYAATARHIDPADLANLPLPAVLHISQGSDGDKGHYWVLDKITGNNVELFDPQSHRRFHQTVAELTAQWSGNVLAFSNGKPVPGRQLDVQELEDAIGGCCGAPAPPSNLGNDPRNNVPGSTGCPNGAPVWSVNMINMNFYVTDIPLWHDSPVGPSVRIQLSYNSQSSIAHYEPFGNKWTFNYGGYLIMDTSGTITIFMPDGRMDAYSPNGSGGYTAPYRVYNTLTLISPNHYQLQFPDGSIYTYQIPPGTTSQQPFLTGVQDAYGNTVTLGYNASVNLTTITDAQGKVFTLTYNANGLVASVADPFGRSATFQYDENNNLTEITDMGGYSSTLTYDTNAFVTSIADERGTTSFRTELPGPAGDNSNNYPPPGDPDMFGCYRITETNALGGLAEFFWYGGCDINGYGNCDGYSWYVSPRDYISWQSQTVNNYRSEAPKTRYLPVRVGSGQQGEFAEILNPEGDYVQYSYNPVTGDRLSATDAKGHTWQYTYNSMGLPTTATDPKSTVTTFAYATNNVDLLAVSNGLGVISVTYNPQHDVLSLTDRLTNVTTFTYNANGQIASQVDALGISNQYIYDGNGLLSQLDRAGFILDSFTHDTVGRIQTHTDATGLVLTYTYNNLNQTVQVTYPDSRFVSYVYSTCCPHIIDSITDRGGLTSYFNYDALKRLTQITNLEGGVTQYGYDANGNRTALTDPDGNVTAFGYDLDNRPVSKTFADNSQTSVQYDIGGLIANRTTARGIVTTYAYDADNNLVTTQYSDRTPGVTNAYDAFNRLVAVNDAEGSNIYTYDADSRLTNFIGPWANDTIAYSLDALGKMTNLAVQGSQAVSYGFDALNRLTSVGVGTGSYNYSFSGANPLVQGLNRPNGSFTIYSYDGLDRLTEIANKQSGGQTINAFSYTYNTQDLRNTETVSNGLGFSFTNGQVVTNNYNALNQLLASLPPNQLFAYDADGNMTQGYTPDGFAFIASYDAENRLKSVVYTNGNEIVSSNRFVYAWNSFSSELLEYHNGALSNDTRFVRSGYLPAQERNSANIITREYVWGLNMGGGIGGLLNLMQSGQDYSYLYDGKGNVGAVVDGSQSVAVAYSYDPFGTQLTTNGTLSQRYRFSTKPYYASVGAYDFGYRFYLPTVSKWMSRDPIQENGGANLYGYVMNNPISYADHLGLSSIIIIVNRTMQTPVTTMGTLTVSVNGNTQFQGYSLEPSGDSIPLGEYGASVYYSPHFHEDVLLLNGTDPRTLIEIHPGNTYKDTHGCILPGMTQSLNQVANSQDAFNSIMDIVENTEMDDLASKQSTTIKVIIK